MVGLVTCKNEEDPSKNLEWSQHFSHYKSMGIFLDARPAKSQVPGWILPNFEESIKNEAARVVTRFSPL